MTIISPLPCIYSDIGLGIQALLKSLIQLGWILWIINVQRKGDATRNVFNLTCSYVAQAVGELEPDHPVARLLNSGTAARRGFRPLVAGLTLCVVPAAGQTVNVASIRGSPAPGAVDY